jgi:hypothetical protein
VTESQTGADAVQSELVTQATQMPPPLTLQSGVGPEQSSLPLHWVQVPPVEQAVSPGNPRQSASPVHGPQVWVADTQTGAAAVQSALVTQATQMPPPLTLQSGVGPEQSSLPLHWVQMPPVEQAVSPGNPRQSASPVHGPQVWVADSQTGADAVQSELVTQATQMPPPLTLQSGVGPEQSSLPLHWVQVPPVEQAVVPGKLAQSPSPVQGPQVCVAVSQTGADAVQFASVRHSTHLPEAGSQTGVAGVAEQSAFVEHCGGAVLVNLHVTSCPSASGIVAVRVAVSPDPTGSCVVSSVQATPVSEKGAASASVTVYCPKVVIPEKTCVLVDEPSSVRVKLDGLSPPVDVKLKLSALSGTVSLTTVIVAGNTTASAEMDRSCFPVLQRPGLHVNAMSAMWYGEPGIETAEFARPQSRRFEMCPPQAMTALGPVAVKVILMLVLLSVA